MKGHVLVVDDEQETCDLLEMSLVRHGFKVTTSTNAQKALDEVATQDFDVVLTDLSMPVEDLPEKIRAYRAERFVVAANDPTEIVTMDELERRYILRVLALVGGNKSRAAQVLGFDRRTLYRKLERYGESGAASESPGKVDEPS